MVFKSTWEAGTEQQKQMESSPGSFVDHAASPVRSSKLFYDKCTRSVTSHQSVAEQEFTIQEEWQPLSLIVVLLDLVNFATYMEMWLG